MLTHGIIDMLMTNVFSGRRQVTLPTVKIVKGKIHLVVDDKGISNMLACIEI